MQHYFKGSSLTCPACMLVKVLISTCVFFCVHRCEVELSTVPVNQRRLFTLTLNAGRGVLVFLLAVNTCSGVTISDLCDAPLDQPQERQNQLDNYVSTFITAETVFASAQCESLVGLMRDNMNMTNIKPKHLVAPVYGAL